MTAIAEAAQRTARRPLHEGAGTGGHSQQRWRSLEGSREDAPDELDEPRTRSTKGMTLTQSYMTRSQLGAAK